MAALCMLALLLAVAPPGAGASDTVALHDEPVFQRLARQQGLPNDVVYSLAQDRQGFVWIGTVSGLARWDGHRAQVHRPDSNRPGSLPDGWIQALVTDPQGRLWVGTSGGGAARWDPVQRRFDSVGRASGDGDTGLSHANVHALLPDGAGGLWAGTDAGLDRIDLETRAVRRHADAGTALQGLPRERVLALLRSRAGALWVGTESGVFRSRTRGGFDAVPLAGMGAAAVHALHEDSAGRVWMGTAAHGAFVWSAGAATARALQLPGLPELADLSVSHIHELRPGVLWLATLGRGVVVVEPGPTPGADGTLQARWQHLRHRPGWSLGLGDDTVRAILRDRSGLVWLATDSGVNIHDATQTALRTVLGLPGVAGGERVEIGALLQAGDGRLWLGTQKQGVAVLDATGGPTTHLRPDRQRPETALPEDIVLALVEGLQGEVWIATKRGLYRARADGSGLQRVTLAGRHPSAAIWALLRQGSLLWVGGATDGLWSLDLTTGRTQHVAHQTHDDAAWRLTDDRVSVLAAAPGDGLWVGTRQGLDRIDPARGAVGRWLASRGDPAGLGSGFVTALHTDAKGRLWVGTFGGGLAVLDPPHQPGAALRRVTAAQGLPDDNINTLVEDARGRLWSSTDSGLALIDPETLRVRGLYDSDGAVFPVYWTGAAAGLRNGDLLFGGAGGMTWVRPEALADWRYVPPLAITALQVGGVAVSPAAFEQRPLQLQPDGNALRVEFAALDYSDARRLRYAVRLDDVDSDWVDVSPDQRLAAYANLPPGAYRLQLRGSNRNGDWAEPPLMLPFEVLPAWHQTWVFRAGALLALGLSAVGLLRLRERSLQQRQTALARAVDERTTQLRELTLRLAEQGEALNLASRTDPLTGLHNRRHLVQRMQGQDSVQPLALLLVDVDHFKQVNDQRGHAVGDAALVAMAARLRPLLGERDECVRWGGEEFLLVLDGADLARAQTLAEIVRRRVADEPLMLRGHGHLQLTVSIGFACLPFVRGAARALDWEAVLNLADQALYAAKRLGRNRWVGLAAGSAAEPAHAEGLPQRAHADPAGCLARGELQALVSGADAAGVAAALQG